MRIHIVGIVLAGALVSEAIAQSPAKRGSVVTPIGTWRGTSLCLVRPSACHDENVVYRITPLNARDSVALDARKIVGGEEQDMGVLHCRFVRLSGQLTCSMRQGIWRFRVRNDSLTGELRLPDNTRFRDVRTKRAR